MTETDTILGQTGPTGSPGIAGTPHGLLDAETAIKEHEAAKSKLAEFLTGTTWTAAQRRALAIRAANVRAAQIAYVYKRPAIEQNFDKRQREHAAFALDCEMFPKVRAIIVARSETTQSQAELDECTAAIAWLDAKMGAI